jgi:hypothetical protein
MVLLPTLDVNVPSPNEVPEIIGSKKSFENITGTLGGGKKP